jgi:two-component system sensor histidine kinase UhpB
LHDQIGQSLTAIKINLQSLMLRSDALRHVPHIEDGIRIVDATIAQVRDLSLALRPPQLDDLGLAAALRWHLDRQAKASGVVVRLEEDLGSGELDSELQSACFRIVQEAVNNALRHARATEIRVAIRIEGEHVAILVADDGAGFDIGAAHAAAAAGGSLGLISMEERAALAGGQLQYRSTPGEGTEVRARLPVIRGADGGGK